jgi:vancomycin resistance protein VanJ
MTEEPAAGRPNWTRQARRAVSWLALAYAVVVGVYLALRALMALGGPLDDAGGTVMSMWLGIGSSLMPALLVPALPLAILAGLLRLPKTALALSPLGIAFLLLYGGMLIPRAVPAAAATDGSRLVVYTHNLHVLNDNLQPAADDIRASGADVVAVQELTQTAADYLAADLADLYPYQALYPVGETTSGSGILSKWPLSSVMTWTTVMLELRATVAWPGGDIAFYNLHPPPPRWFLRAFDASDRRRALEESLRRAAAEPLPVVLAGDLNLTDQTQDYQTILGAGFQDSFREAGWGLGLTFADFSYLSPLLAVAPRFIRIDYVFADETFTPVDAQVGAAAGSDHYAVRAVLAVAAP